MRALAISDLHFGAWTGYDTLADPLARERLAPLLEDLDELILLGDIHDWLFSSVANAIDRSEPLFELIREKLAGKKVVWLAGNHDHHVMVRELEDMLRADLLGETAPDPWMLRFLRNRLEGVECSIAYPGHPVGNVLCCHGHYLDAHVEGSLANRLLTRGLWTIAGGRPTEPLTIADYEASMIPLTELLYTVAQLPRGTSAQESVLEAVHKVAHVGRALSAPKTEIRHVVDRMKTHSHDHHKEHVTTDEVRAVGNDEPVERALNAYAEVTRTLGWDGEYDHFVFAHTHQPLDGVTAAGHKGRFWNTGCWIYEPPPDAAGPDAFERYKRIAWPGTAVLIDTREPQPRLIRTMQDVDLKTLAPTIGAAGV
jgi:hypothetical protein